MDATRHGRMAHAQPFGGHRQAALTCQGEENTEIVPVGTHEQKCTGSGHSCRMTNSGVRPRVGLAKTICREPRMARFVTVWHWLACARPMSGEGDIGFWS